MRRKSFEKSQNVKNPTKREYSLWNQDLDRTEKKKEKNNGELDYGRLGSVNGNWREVQREKNGKRRLN